MCAHTLWKKSETLQLCISYACVTCYGPPRGPVSVLKRLKLQHSQRLRTLKRKSLRLSVGLQASFNGFKNQSLGEYDSGAQEIQSVVCSTKKLLGLGKASL